MWKKVSYEIRRGYKWLKYVHMPLFVVGVALVLLRIFGYYTSIGVDHVFIVAITQIGILLQVLSLALCREEQRRWREEGRHTLEDIIRPLAEAGGKPKYKNLTDLKQAVIEKKSEMNCSEVVFGYHEYMAFKRMSEDEAGETFFYRYRRDPTKCSKFLGLDITWNICSKELLFL